MRSESFGYSRILQQNKETKGNQKLLSKTLEQNWLPRVAEKTVNFAPFAPEESCSLIPWIPPFDLLQKQRWKYFLIIRDSIKGQEILSQWFGKKIVGFDIESFMVLTYSDLQHLLSDLDIHILWFASPFYFWSIFIFKVNSFMTCTGILLSYHRFILDFHNKTTLQ